jgi:hypothetical protein
MSAETNRVTPWCACERYSWCDYVWSGRCAAVVHLEASGWSAYVCPNEHDAPHRYVATGEPTPASAMRAAERALTEGGATVPVRDDAELANGFVEQWLSESADAVALVEHTRRDERAQIVAWARATEASIRESAARCDDPEARIERIGGADALDALVHRLERRCECGGWLAPAEYQCDACTGRSE